MMENRARGGYSQKCTADDIAVGRLPLANGSPQSGYSRSICEQGSTEYLVLLATLSFKILFLMNWLCRTDEPDLTYNGNGNYMYDE